MSPMPSFQSQMAKSTSQKYHGHSSPGAGPSGFSMPGTWERPGRKCSGDSRPFHQVCPGVCYKDPHGSNNGKDLVGQVHCSLWSSQKILTDQGHNFESQLVADLCKLMGVQKIQTSLYHLQTNGQCERFNSTLINMLETIPKEKKSEWRNHIGTLVHAYNCTQNSATGFSPYYLMFGRQPHLPVDVALGLAPHTIIESNTTKFVQKLREWNKWAHEKAETFQAKEAKRHKYNYDKKGRAAALEVRDMVLVHVTTFKC